jgi:RNA polymerase sigma-19 factor, ECF subfamily
VVRPPRASIAVSGGLRYLFVPYSRQRLINFSSINVSVMQAAVLFKNDHELIREFREGNVVALQMIYKLHYHSLLSFASRVIKDEMISEDIVAETFVKLWERRERFENIKGLVGFLFTVVKNECISFIKEEKRKSHILAEFNYLDNRNTDFTDDEQIRSELIKLAMLEGTSLPPGMKRVFNLLYIEGLSVRQISHELNLSVNTIQEQRAQAIKKLRKVFSQKYLRRFF